MEAVVSFLIIFFRVPGRFDQMAVPLQRSSSSSNFSSIGLFYYVVSE